MALLTVNDLAPFATIEEFKADAMVADAIALATMAAPCLGDESGLTAQQIAAAKAILRAAVLRWDDAGSGAITQQVVGPYQMSVDTKQARRSMFWPSEITALQRICKGGSDGGAFSVDTAAEPMEFHSVLCSYSGGACTCGAIAFDTDYTA